MGSLGSNSRVILVLPECIWNVSAVSLVLPGFDDTSSLGSPPCEVVYPPSSMIPPWVTVSRFFTVNIEAELKTQHFLFTPIFPFFSSFLLF